MFAEVANCLFFGIKWLIVFWGEINWEGWLIEISCAFIRVMGMFFEAMVAVTAAALQTVL